jgi:plasmid stabilization system protein ParE
MSGYRLSRDAERDLLEIARYVAEKSSVEIAERLLTEIIETIIVLGAQPGIGRAEEGFARGVLSFPSHKYNIYYRKRKGGIIVLHVFHGARDQKKAWKKAPER